jgi:hypothetical protein
MIATCVTLYFVGEKYMPMVIGLQQNNMAYKWEIAHSML